MPNDQPADKTLLPDLAALIAGLKASALDPTVVENVKLHALDALGCTWAGAETSEIRATHDALRRASFATPGAKNLLDHPIAAAAMLVTACRLTECDDIHIGCCVTPSSVVVPVALVAGQMAGATSDAVLEGMLAGYQAMLTLGLAANGAEIIYKGVWPTYLTAGIGAAAIAAKVMGLNERQTRDAMAIAGSSATGITGRIEEEPAPRWFLLASAVQSGLLAAAAAASGLHGDESILGKVSPVWNPETVHVPDNRGQLLAPRIGFKPYSTSRQGLSATEAFIGTLRRDYVDPASIEKITVEVPQQYKAMIDRNRRPKTKSESRGIHYQFALGALHPDELCDIERATIHTEDPAMLKIMDAIEVLPSERLSKLYPRQWGGAVVVRAGGMNYRHELLHPRGDPENPLSWDDITAKLDTMSLYLKRSIPTKDFARQMQALDFRGALTTVIEAVAIR
ncbi:MAG TPA: MmgE/PrpD family protein [Stellaceae bacterium]|jgi:2-methylcitrate dehydratase PrpD|nr:MmgE/PrpD family protein [Stellaceae bacterium]